MGVKWFGFLWSVWHERNLIVFQNKTPNWENLCFIVKLRVGYWLKGWCPEFPYALDNVVYNLNAIRMWGNKNWK